MNKPALHVIGNSMQDLAQLALVPPPAPPVIDFNRSPEEIREQAKARGEAIRKEAAKVFELATLARTVYRISTELGIEEQEDMPPDVEQDVEQAGEYIRALLAHTTPAYRRSTMLGILKSDFDQAMESLEETGKLFTALASEGLLEEHPHGIFRANGRNYTLPANLLHRFDRNRDRALARQIDEVVASLKKLFDRLWEKERKIEEEQKQKLATMGRLSFSQVAAGNTGTWSARVPQRMDPRVDGRILPGGVILVHSNGKAVFPQKSSGQFTVGPIRTEVRGETQAIGISIKSLVDGNRPDFTDFVADRQDLGKLHFTYNLLCLAAREEERTTQIAPIKQAMASAESLSPHDWLINGALGTCFMTLDVWMSRNRDTGVVMNLIFDVFFRVERLEIDGKRMIRLVEVPEHLHDFFAESMDQYEEGKRFDGCEHMLRAVLMSLYGKALEAAKDAEKAEAIKQ